MTTIEENLTQYITFDKGNAPSTPASGSQVLYVKSDDKIYTKTDAGVETEVGASGSGGATIHQAVYASPPSTPADGDDWHVSDSGLIAHRASSAWRYYGPVHEFTLPPAVGQWTALNLSTNALGSWTRGVIDFYDTTSAGNNMRGYHRPLPTPAKVIMAAQFCLESGNNIRMGMFVRESSSGKLRAFQLVSSQSTVGISSWASESSFAAGTTTQGIGAVSLGALIWMKYEEDNTNRNFSVSCNGVNWLLLLSEAKDYYCIADQVGFAGFVTDGSAAVQNHMTVWSWAEG